MSLIDQLNILAERFNEEAEIDEACVCQDAAAEIDRLNGVLNSEIEAHDATKFALVDANVQVAEARREVERLRDLVESVKLEARLHSGEARCHRSTVHSIYQIVTGAKGEPGNWHGAAPICEAFGKLESELAEARRALDLCTESENEYHGKRLSPEDWIAQARKEMT